MPRRITAAEAEALLASGKATPRRRISAAEAEEMLAGGKAFTEKPETEEAKRARDLSTFDQRFAEGNERGLGTLLSLTSGSELVDELAGVVGAAQGKGYTKSADEAQRAVDLATKQNSPVVDVGGVKIPLLPLAGALISSGPAGAARTALPRVLAAMFQGGFTGGAGSRARVGREGVGEVAKDTGIGTGLGLLAGAGGEVVGELAGRAGRWLAGRQGAAETAVREATETAAKKAVGSAVGAENSATAAAMRSAEHTFDVLRNPGAYDEATTALHQAKMAEPEFRALVNQVAMNAPARLETQMAKMPGLRAAREEAVQAATPEAIDAATAARLEDTPGRLLKNASRSIGQRAALGLVGAGIGSLIGDEKGTTFGAMSGFAAPGVLQFLRNTAKDPAMHARLAQALQKATSAASASAPAMSRVGAELAPYINARPPSDEAKRQALIDAIRGTP